MDKNSKEKRKQKAKALIISGNSLAEASQKTGLSRGTLSTISSKEKLQDKRANYINNFYMSLLEKIEENKKDRFEMNSIITKQLKKELVHYVNNNEVIPLDFIKRLGESQRLENEIIEVDAIDNYFIKTKMDDKDEKIKSTLDILAEKLQIN